MHPRARPSLSLPCRQHLAPWLVGLLLTGATATLQAAVIRVGQPGEPGCDQPSLQAAINAAAAAPGLDVIRVSAGTYPGQLLLVNDSGDLAIEGGFLNCSTPVANAGTTTLSAQGTPGGSVISHIGSGRLTLSDLGITAGDASAGGGIHSPGAAPLTLQRVQLYNNRANAGGGLAVGNNNAGALKEVNLLGVAFTSNVAQSMGGGIYAVNAHVRITGDSPNQFLANWAHGANVFLGGGAIYAVNSALFIHSLSPVLGAFMDSNLATQSSGGAIAFIGSAPGYYPLTVMNRSGGDPLRVVGNGAARGAAIALRAGEAAGAVTIAATLYDTIVEDNQGGDAIIHLHAVNDGPLSRAGLTMTPSTFGMIAPRCLASLRCNRLESNDSTNSTVSVNSGGTTGLATFGFHRGHMIDNYSANGALIHSSGTVFVNNSVLANNSLADTLISGVGAQVQIENSTIAGNYIGEDYVVAMVSSGAALTLHNSIVFQPGKQLRLLGAPATANLRNLLLNPDHGVTNIAGLNIQGNLLPWFVNPAQDDFRLQPGSQASNRWAPDGNVNVPTIDLLGGTRPADPPGTPTPYDFGAYELGAVVDGMFFGNFDG